MGSSVCILFDYILQTFSFNDQFNMERHTESCIKRKSLQDVIEQDTNRAREEDQTDNQPPNEDIVSDYTETCFNGTLQTKIFRPRGSKDILKTLENYKIDLLL